MLSANVVGDLVASLIFLAYSQPVGFGVVSNKLGKVESLKGLNFISGHSYNLLIDCFSF